MYVPAITTKTDDWATCHQSSSGNPSESSAGIMLEKTIKKCVGKKRERKV